MTEKISALQSERWTCQRCGCDRHQPCRIEVTVARPNGRQALLAGACGWSAPGLCTACDERMLPELESLLELWRELGALAIAFRDA